MNLLVVSHGQQALLVLFVLVMKKCLHSVSSPPMVEVIEIS